MSARHAPKPAARRHPLDDEPAPTTTSTVRHSAAAMTMTALNVKIPAALHDRLRLDAARSRQRMAAIVADAIAAWYEAHPDRGL